MLKVVGSFGAAIAIAALAACSEQPSAATEEAALKAQNQNLVGLIANHNAQGIAELYASDGVFMPPNAPKIEGREQITAAWTAMFQTPGFSYTLTSDKIVFGTGADLATDLGTYEYKGGNGATVVTDKGKSVINWVKRDGKWMILAQSYSSDAPLLPQTPTPPSAATTPTDPAATGETTLTPPAETAPVTTPDAPPTTPPAPAPTTTPTP